MERIYGNTGYFFKHVTVDGDRSGKFEAVQHFLSPPHLRLLRFFGKINIAVMAETSPCRFFLNGNWPRP